MKIALLVVFAAHADTYFYSKSLDADENQHEQLAALFDLHMIEGTQTNPYQLNVDTCLKDSKIFWYFMYDVLFVFVFKILLINKQHQL